MDTIQAIDNSKPATSLVASGQVRAFIFTADCLGLFICLQVSYLVWISRPLLEFNLTMASVTGLVLLVLYLTDTYAPDHQVAGLRAPIRVVLSTVVVAGIAAAVLYWLEGLYPAIASQRRVLLLTLVMFTIWAVALRLVAVSWVRSHAHQRRWLLIGTGEASRQLHQDFCAASPAGQLVTQAEVVVSGSQSLSTAKLTATWSGVIIENLAHMKQTHAHQLMEWRLQGVPIYTVPDIYETLWYKLPSAFLQDTWFMFTAGFHLLPGRINDRLKRLFDVIGAASLLVLLSPLLLLAMLAIQLDDPGSVFYSQLRSGLHQQPFRMYKFRTMVVDAERAGPQWAQQGDPRVTRVGYWLRLTRVDELPQLWNVLRGEMSLIGPRPERPEFDSTLAESIPYYEVRYLVRPGITGWAQVMYPYGASIQDACEKLAYDLYYIKNYSIWLDIAIAFKTLRVMILGKGR